MITLNVMCIELYCGYNMALGFNEPAAFNLLVVVVTETSLVIKGRRMS